MDESAISEKLSEIDKAIDDYNSAPLTWQPVSAKEAGESLRSVLSKIGKEWGSREEK